MLTAPFPLRTAILQLTLWQLVNQRLEDLTLDSGASIATQAQQSLNV